MRPDIRWRLWAEVLRVWLPIMVSLCAISLTIYQASLARRHARLSVQPRLDWRVEHLPSDGMLRLSLVNVGLGPAILSDITLLFDGQPIGPIGEAACSEIDRRLHAPGGHSRCAQVVEDYALRPGDSLQVYEAPVAIAGPADPLAELVRHFAVRARYCSFYDQCWQLEGIPSR